MAAGAAALLEEDFTTGPNVALHVARYGGLAEAAHERRQKPNPFVRKRRGRHIGAGHSSLDRIEERLIGSAPNLPAIHEARTVTTLSVRSMTGAASARE